MPQAISPSFRICGAAPKRRHTELEHQAQTTSDSNQREQPLEHHASLGVQPLAVTELRQEGLKAERHVRFIGPVQWWLGEARIIVRPNLAGDEGVVAGHSSDRRGYS